MSPSPTRRALVRGISAGLATALAAPALAQTLAEPPVGPDAGIGSRRNVSGFRLHRPEDHFDGFGVGAVLCDTSSRMLQHWAPDGTMRVYPTSVPVSEEMTRRGRTEVIRKVVGPSWSPTPSMKLRNPDWPDYWPPGPDNPLGTHALYLGWTYYRIHGTGDTRKIGRRSSNGCIGLYNEHIAELFALVPTGTQVRVI